MKHRVFCCMRHCIKVDSGTASLRDDQRRSFTQTQPQHQAGLKWKGTSPDSFKIKLFHNKIQHKIYSSQGDNESKKQFLFPFTLIFRLKKHWNFSVSVFSYSFLLLFRKKHSCFCSCCSDLSLQFEAHQRASKQPFSASNSLKICPCVMGVTPRWLILSKHCSLHPAATFITTSLPSAPAARV